MEYLKAVDLGLKIIPILGVIIAWFAFVKFKIPALEEKIKETKTDLKEAQQNHKAEIMALKKEHETALKALKKEHEAENKAIKEDYEQKINKLEEKTTSLIKASFDGIKEFNQGNFDTLHKSLSRIEDDKKRSQEAREFYITELAEIKAHLDNAVKRMEEDRKEFKSHINARSR